MKRLLLITALVAAPFGMLACTETVYHKEQTKTNWDGSKTHQETTVRQNPDGTTTTDTEKVQVKD